jgi:hypothetical protein
MIILQKSPYLSDSVFSQVGNDSGELVDDYYLPEDGEDDAPSIRRAFAVAVLSPVAKLVFTNRVYKLASNEDVYNCDKVYPAVGVGFVHKGAKLEAFALIGNRATFRKSGSDLEDMFFIHLNTKRIYLYDFTCERIHLTPQSSEPAYKMGGIKITHTLQDPEINLIHLKKVTFSDCHRSLEISGSNMVGAINGFRKIKNVLLEEVDMLYPRGANFISSYGGSQGALFTNAIDIIIINRCGFDGATEGSTSSGVPPVDGWFFCHAINSLVVNSHLQHFAIEGAYFVKTMVAASPEGSFVVPAVGENVLVSIYPLQNLEGWQAGDRCWMSIPGQEYIFTHEFEVVTVSNSPANGPKSLLVKVISGPAVSITGGMWLSHELFVNTETHATFQSNVAENIAVEGFEAYTPVEFNRVDHGIARNNRMGPTNVCVQARWNKSIYVADNELDATWVGVTYLNPNENCRLIVKNNNIKLSGSGYLGNPESLFGTASHAADALYEGNHIFMDTPIAGVGVGIQSASSLDGPSGQVINNTFTNLNYGTYNVDPSGSFIESGNTKINCAH